MPNEVEIIMIQVSRTTSTERYTEGSVLQSFLNLILKELGGYFFKEYVDVMIASFRSFHPAPSCILDVSGTVLTSTATHFGRFLFKEFQSSQCCFQPAASMASKSNCEISSTILQNVKNSTVHRGDCTAKPSVEITRRSLQSQASQD
jgi:hypothetical protein